MNIYCQTWETSKGDRINIAFTWYEMKKMPYAYRYEKRKDLFEQHRFNYKDACVIREWFFNDKNEICTGAD